MSVYHHLPPVGSLPLPKLEWIPTSACSARGMPIRRVWDHRWGSPGGHGRISGVITEFEHAVNQASAHFVYAGRHGPDKGRCVQMVPLSKKSWTEAFYNRSGVSIEAGDAIWLLKDPEGFAQLARINAYLLHRLGLPPKWVHGRLISVGRGFSRHADGGRLAGGHTACPTTDPQLWQQFCVRVQLEHGHGRFRHVPWGRA